MNQVKPLHIVFLTQWYPNSKDPQNGVFIQKHAKALSKFHQVTVLYVRSEEGLDDYEEHTTTKRNGRLIQREFTYSAKKGPLGKMKAWKTAFSRIDEVDVVHLNVLDRDCVLWELWLKKRKVPFVIQEHASLYLKDYNKHSLFHFARKRLIKKAFRIIPVSEHLKENMLSKGLRGRYQVIPNIVNIPHPIERSNPTEPISLISVGDLVNSVKQFDQIIQALLEFDGPWTYDIVGDGEDREALEQLSEKLFSNDPNRSVKFLGRKTQKDVQKILPSYSVLISNSAFETFGLVVLEALASGVVVISRETGISNQYVVNGKNGWLMQSSEEVSEILRDYVRNPEQLDKILISKKDLKAFSPRKFRKQMYRIYDQMGLFLA